MQPHRNRKVVAQPNASVDNDGNIGDGKGLAMGFSENLHHLRTVRNMTQEQLAMLMGVSRQAISKWESSRAYPEMDKLVRLCGIFECDLDDLVTGDLAGADVKPELAIPGDAPAVDVCGYDRHMRVRAFMLATAAAVPMLGLAVFFGTSGNLAYPGTSRATIGSFLLAAPLGTAALVVAIVIGIALAAKAVADRLRFRALYPCIDDFYTSDQRERTARLVRRARVVALAALVIGAAACMIKAGPLCHMSGGLASLAGWGAVAVWTGVYAALMTARLNVDGYNERNAQRLDQQAALARMDNGPAPVSLGRDAGLTGLAERWLRRQTIVLCLAALAVFGIIACVFALLGWVIWFIPVVVGLVLAGLIWLFMPYAR